MRERPLRADPPSSSSSSPKPPVSPADITDVTDAADETGWRPRPPGCMEGKRARRYISVTHMRLGLERPTRLYLLTLKRNGRLTVERSESLASWPFTLVPPFASAPPPPRAGPTSPAPPCPCGGTRASGCREGESVTYPLHIRHRRHRRRATCVIAGADARVGCWGVDINDTFIHACRFHVSYMAVACHSHVTTPPCTHLRSAPETLNPQPSTLNPQPSTLNPQPSALSPQPSTLSPQPSTTPSCMHLRSAPPAPRADREFVGVSLPASVRAIYPWIWGEWPSPSPPPPPPHRRRAHPDPLRHEGG